MTTSKQGHTERTLMDFESADAEGETQANNFFQNRIFSVSQSFHDTIHRNSRHNLNEPRKVTRTDAIENKTMTSIISLAETGVTSHGISCRRLMSTDIQYQWNYEESAEVKAHWQVEHATYRKCAGRVHCCSGYGFYLAFGNSISWRQRESRRHNVHMGWLCHKQILTREDARTLLASVGKKLPITQEVLDNMSRFTIRYV